VKYTATLLCYCYRVWKAKHLSNFLLQPEMDRYITCVDPLHNSLLIDHTLCHMFTVLIKGKGKGVPYHAHMAHWGRGGITPLFLNLGTGRG
jgi:hypothetical protein